MRCAGLTTPRLSSAVSYHNCRMGRAHPAEVHPLDLAQFSEHQDQSDSLQTKNDELRNRVEELEYELGRLQAREEKLDLHLSECLQRLKGISQAEGGADLASLGSVGGGSNGGPGGLAAVRLEDLQSQLEEQRELASARIMELEQLHHDHKEALKVRALARLAAVF